MPISGFVKTPVRKRLFMLSTCMDLPPPCAPCKPGALQLSGPPSTNWSTSPAILARGSRCLFLALLLMQLLLKPGLVSLVVAAAVAARLLVVAVRPRRR